MIEFLKEIDTKLLLFLNQFHTSWLDAVMFLMTKILFWLPIYAFLTFLIFKNYKKHGWLVLAGALLAILLSDQITSTFMKPFFARLRPSHDPSLEGIVHLVNGYRGGLYGFASGHAATTFAVASFVWLSLRPFYRWMGLVFLWAAVMTYTRIYLGVHYPGDILTGASIGFLCGWFGFKFSSYLQNRSKKTPSVS